MHSTGRMETQLERKVVMTMLNVEYTSDRVNVVRCRDCKHAKMTYRDECKYCDFWQEDGSEALYLDGDFFCAAGERRDKE